MVIAIAEEDDMDPIKIFGVRSSDVPLWSNFVAVYDGTSELERRRGNGWYTYAWNQSRAFAETHWSHGTQRRTAQAAAIVAALSQNTGWDRTLELAVATFRAKGELSGGTFEPVRDKCSLLFHGAEPIIYNPDGSIDNERSVLGGPKIRAFYACIAAQGNCSDVVIDRHMAHMAWGRILEDRERNQVLRQTKSRDGYGSAADALVEACLYVNRRDSEHWTPAKFQAALWIAWRNCLLGEERGFTATERDRSLDHAGA